jgi:hypothetical protein
MSLFTILPPELIAQILRELDPASFYICLQTSPQFRDHALASARLLLRQLARIPGPRIFYSNIEYDAVDLLKTFSQGAAQHLFNGVEHMADVDVWLAPAKMDRKISCIVRPYMSVFDDFYEDRDDWLSRNARQMLLFIEARPAEGIVNVHTIQESGLTLAHVVSPYTINQYLPAIDEDGIFRYEILRIAVGCSQTRLKGSPCVAILYRAKHSSKDKDTTQAKVVRFQLDHETGPMVTEIYNMEFSRETTIIAFALNSDLNPVIAFRNRHLCTGFGVTSYRNEIDELTLKSVTKYAVHSPVPSDRSLELVGSMSVQGENIHLHSTAIPLPHWTLSKELQYPETELRFTRRNTNLPHLAEAFARPSIGRAIACYHHHEVLPPNRNGGPLQCLNTALELAISRGDNGEQPFIPSSRKGAYLLKAVEYSDQCLLYNLNRDYTNLYHIYVAQLADLDLDNIPSIGLKLAVSPRAQRIAISNWRTLFVYPLDPNAFLDPGYGLCDENHIPGDYAYFESCGQEFYENGECKEDCVLLKPITLECKGVIFGLEWRNEDELWGLTEEGVVRWRIGVGTEGRRGRATLETTHLESLTGRVVGK